MEGVDREQVILITHNINTPLQYAQVWFTSTDLSGFESIFEWAVFLHEKDETIWTPHTYDNAYLDFYDRTDQPINASYSRLHTFLIQVVIVIGQQHCIHLLGYDQNQT